MMNDGARTPAIALLLAVTLGARAVFAAGPEGAVDGDRAAALTWANKAQDRFDAADYRGAVDAIREAQKHARPPTFDVLLGQAHEKLGQLVEAEAAYRAAADLALPKTAPRAWSAAQTEAKQALSRLTPTIPRLTITLTGADPSVAQVTLDDAPFQTANLGRPFAVNPGKHRISASAPGKTRVDRQVSLEARGAETVAISLLPEGPAPVPTPSSSITAAPTSSADRGAPSGTSALKVGRFLSIGLTGAGAIAAGVTFGLAATATADIQSRCHPKCPVSEKDKVSAAGALADVATASAIVAGVFAAAGVTLWLLPNPKSSPQVGVTATPSGLLVQGSF